MLPQPTARKYVLATALAAAKDAEARCSENQLKALRLISQRPMTDFELADATGIQQTSIGKRRGELYKAGYVTPSIVGIITTTRPSPSGSAATVWEITARGLDYLKKVENKI